MPRCYGRTLTSCAQVHLCRCLANEMQSVGYSTSFPGIIDPGDPPCSQPNLLLSLLSSSSLPPLLLPRQQRTPPDWSVVSRMGLARWPFDPTASFLFFSAFPFLFLSPAPSQGHSHGDTASGDKRVLPDMADAQIPLLSFQF